MTKRSESQLALVEAKVRQSLELEEIERRHHEELATLEAECKRSDDGQQWPDPSWVEVMSNADLDC